MARGRDRSARKRAATIDDLTSEQNDFYTSLPEALRDRHVASLPPVRISTAGNQKKARLIRERMQLLDSVINEFENQRKELTQSARSLDQGLVSASSVDLRTLLTPP